MRIFPTLIAPIVKSAHMRSQYAQARAMRGVTLIEILVVLSVLAMAALTVLLNAPPARDRVKSAAEVFAAALLSAEDQAMTAGRPLRFIITPDGWRIERYVSPIWAPVRFDRAPSSAVFTDGLLLDMEADDPFAANKEQARERRLLTDQRPEDQEIFVLDPAGVSGALNVTFSRQGQRWRVVRSGEGLVSVERG